MHTYVDRWFRARGFAITAGVTLLAAVTAGAARAQTAPGAKADAGQMLQEVIVTAEKRESTVQKTPISISAISGTELAAQGVTDLLRVAEETPGMSFRSAGPGQTEFEIRGLASSGGAAPTVGFYFNEVPISPPALGTIGKVAIDPNLFDLARVEVLRGPQGTLYGSGSMGGTIKVITNTPDLTRFEGAGQVVASETEGGGFNRGGNLMLNLPLASGTTALRLVLTDTYNEGWIDRKVLNPFPFPTNTGCAPTVFYGCARGNVLTAPVQTDYKNVNWEHLESARASLRFKPNDALNIVIDGMYQSIHMGGPSQYDDPPGSGAGKPAHYQAGDFAEPFRDSMKLISATATYDWRAMSLTSTTAYWTRDMYQLVGQAEAFQSTYGLNTFVADNYNGENDNLHQLSEEIRLASTGTDRFQWLVGAFFSHLDSVWGQHSFSPELAYLTPDSVGGPASNPLGDVYDSNVLYKFTQSALFSDVSYQVSDHTKLTAGLRYFKYSSDLFAAQSGLFAQSVNATPVYNSVSASDNGLNPKVNVSYTPTDNLTLYATIAKGFRPGGVNLPLPTQGPNSCLAAFQQIGLDGSPATYKPDSVWSYEVGEKARLDEGRLVINGALYYMRWSNVQQLIPLSCGWFITENASMARSYGPEIEITSRLSHDVTLSVNGTYTKAEITDPGSHTGLTAGSPILNIPKYSANAALSYEHPLNPTYDFTARVSASFTGPVHDVSYTYYDLPAYSLLYLRAGLASDKWTFNLFLDNLTNKHVALTANNTSWGVNIPSLTRISENQPRTFGASVTYRF